MSGAAHTSARELGRITDWQFLIDVVSGEEFREWAVNRRFVQYADDDDPETASVLASLFSLLKELTAKNDATPPRTASDDHGGMG